ncbi:MDR/zinc-dependent alcohol dehydrogenase-like family protein [Kozakia baliensis]|uniref:hypothetical protein n=1 Tax=Kozakia baliensis TaxID=153496 RepID=UPI000ACC3FFA|nr:hypothetical protein [Kozakia baliensis]
MTISCGECRQGKWGNWNCCARTNPNGREQAEYLRVPYADVGLIVIPDGLDDEQVIFLSDILPTGCQAAEYCEITPEAEKTIAVWGCGPVGVMAIRSCFLLGAKRVTAIDEAPERLALAHARGAETIDRWVLN